MIDKLMLQIIDRQTIMLSLVAFTTENKKRIYSDYITIVLIQLAKTFVINRYSYRFKLHFFETL